MSQSWNIDDFKEVQKLKFNRAILGGTDYVRNVFRAPKKKVKAPTQTPTNVKYVFRTFAKLKRLYHFIN